MKMLKNKDSISSTFIVVILLCLVCSVIVSASVLFLKPIQKVNAERDIQQNILKVANIPFNKSNISDIYNTNIIEKILDLQSGELSDKITPEIYNKDSLGTNIKYSKKLSAKQDIAKIIRRENFAKIYFVKKNNKVDSIILPIHGLGLWSMMYAFIAITPDGKKVKGITFYKQGETPGLGGEVENLKWQEQFKGKTIYKNNSVGIKLVKKIPDIKPNKYFVDALSGATLTTNGVQNTIDFWFGKLGYKKFIENLKEGDV